MGQIIFIPNGQKEMSVTIDITDDQEVESNEPLMISFMSPDLPSDMQNFPSPSITIVDNDMSK